MEDFSLDGLDVIYRWPFLNLALAKCKTVLREEAPLFEVAVPCIKTVKRVLPKCLIAKVQLAHSGHTRRSKEMGDFQYH